MYLRKSDYFIVKIDFYRRGKYFKYLVNYNIKKIRGILTPYRIVMYQANGKGNTELKIKNIRYNMGISRSLFSKEALR